MRLTVKDLGSRARSQIPYRRPQDPVDESHCALWLEFARKGRRKISAVGMRVVCVGNQESELCRPLSLGKRCIPIMMVPVDGVHTTLHSIC